MPSTLSPENLRDFLIYPMLVKATEHVDNAIVYKRDLYNFASFIYFIVMSSVGSIGINVVAVEYDYKLSFKSIQRCRGYQNDQRK